MKRYWLFVGEQYYPNGGILDLHSSYDTAEEAEAAGKAEIDTGFNDKWFQVVDPTSSRILSQDSFSNEFIEEWNEKHP